MNRHTIRHPQGNAFKLGIPLSKHIVEYRNGVKSQTDESLSPLLDGAPIKVIFGRGAICAKRYEFTASLVDGYVVVEDKGTLPRGTYSLTVLATDSNGDPLRYKENFALRIVDTTAEANYEDLQEYDGYFKFPILKKADGGGQESGIVITDDEIQLHEGLGFYAEKTDTETKLYARPGLSLVRSTDDEIQIIIND